MHRTSRPLRRLVAGALPAALVALGLASPLPASAAPADLDTAFGTGGTVTTPMGADNAEVAAVAVQPDGRIVVAGHVGGTAPRFAVLRYDPDGRLDPWFGTGGHAAPWHGAADERAHAVAVDGNGRILVAGASGASLAVVRLLPDGRPDRAFGDGGWVTASIGSGAVGRAIALAPGGRIVVAGETVDSGSRRAVVVRLEADGSFDTSLDGDGRMAVNNPDSPGADVVADALAVLPDGRIVLAGGTGPGCASGAGECDIEVSRWLPGGGIDPTMDADGESTTRIGAYDRAFAVAMQPDGRTVAAGVTATGGERRVALVRYTAEDGNRPGNLDGSFGTGGIVTTAVGSGAEARGLALLPDGRILVAGTATSGGTRSFLLARYLGNGDPDTSFGSGGRVLTPFAGADAEGRAVALVPDGRVVVAGTALRSGDNDAAVARYAGEVSGRILNGTDATGSETTGSVVFTVTLARGDAETVTVQYATADGTAHALRDYTPAQGTLTFGPGETSKTVAVGVPRDGQAEPDETLRLELGPATPADTRILRTQLVGTIVDDPSRDPGVPAGAGAGYRLVASDGGIFAFGDATFHGSTGDLALNQPIVGMARTPSGAGYWLFAGDGGIFAFGDAGFHGSTGDIRLASPIVAMQATPSGRGYWLAAADGGIFAFGDAAFHGSTGNIRLARPIVGMQASPSGNGYRLVADDGGIFAFGDATFVGSTGDIRLARPIVGMTATRTGRGYWLVADDGGIFAFGDASFLGSTGDIRLARPIVGMSAM